MNKYNYYKIIILAIINMSSLILDQIIYSSCHWIKKIIFIYFYNL